MFCSLLLQYSNASKFCDNFALSVQSQQLTNSFQRPISAQWTITTGTEHCLDETVHYTVASTINVVTDFFVVLIPIPVVAKLKMPPRQKAIVISLFALGFAVCIIGIIRIVFLSISLHYIDREWVQFPAHISGAVQVYIGIVSCPPKTPDYAAAAR